MLCSCSKTVNEQAYHLLAHLHHLLMLTQVSIICSQKHLLFDFICAMIQINESAHKAVFDLEDIENCNIQILNSLGAQIESFQINAQQMTLDLSKFPKGNYAIKLETSKQTFLKTIEII